MSACANRLIFYLFFIFNPGYAGISAQMFGKNYAVYRGPVGRHNEN